MRKARRFAVLLVALGFTTMATSSSADQFGCLGILGECQGDDTCTGDFAVQNGCETTCYDLFWPPPPEAPYYVVSDTAQCIAG